MSYSKRPTLKGIGIASAAVLATATLSSCAQEVTEDAYCTEKNDEGEYVVVDEDVCDDDARSGGGGGYFIYYGNFGSSYRPGQTLPSGGSSFKYTDSKAREKIGLPKSGKITSGGGFGTKTTYSKGGGFGSGGGKGFGG